MEEAKPRSSDTRAVLLIFCMPLILGAVYLITLAIVSARSAYSWHDMDWNADGHTSIREFFQTPDVLARTIERDGQKCKELFWAKDGVKIRVECPAGAAPPTP